MAHKHIIYSTPLTDVGFAIKSRLLALNRTDVWLFDEIEKRSGKSIDHSYFNRLITGKEKSKPKMELIEEILSEEEERQKGE